MRILANTTTLPLFAPLGAVVVAWTALTWVEPIPASAAAVVAVAPFLLFGGGAALAASLRLSNAALQFLLLAAAQLALAHAGTAPDAAAASAGLAALLVPLNFAVLGALADRGLASRDGLARWLALAGQGGLAGLAVALAPDAVAAVLTAPPLPWPLPMPAPTLAAAAVAVTVAAIVFRRRGTPLEAGALAALVALVAAFAEPPASAGATLLLGTAGLILAVAVLQSGRRLALPDELTRLPGRRALELDLKRRPGRCAVALVDVDEFKSVNERHGHDVGDQALRLIARCLRQAGGGGQPYRHGGDQFALVFPGRTADQSAAALDELRAWIAATPFRLRRPDRPASWLGRARRGSGRPARILQLTVSIGVADRDDPRRPPGAVVKAAAEALRRAKAHGRNRVAR